MGQLKPPGWAKSRCKNQPEVWGTKCSFTGTTRCDLAGIKRVNSAKSKSLGADIAIPSTAQNHVWQYRSRFFQSLAINNECTTQTHRALCLLRRPMLRGENAPRRERLTHGHGAGSTHRGRHCAGQTVSARARIPIKPKGVPNVLSPPKRCSCKRKLGVFAVDFPGIRYRSYFI